MILLNAMVDQHGYALWLSSWYPNKLEPLSGDFIQRHATAVSAKLPVHVVCFIFDANAEVTTEVLVEQQSHGLLTETIVYFHLPQKGPKIWQKWLQWKTMQRLMFEHASNLEQSIGKSRLIHAHVAVYAGLLAHELAKKWQLPFYISEHWTEYLPEANPNFRNANPWLRWRWKKAMQAAANRSAVSDYLATTLTELCGKPVVRIPNVVDTRIFFPQQIQHDSRRLIHISTFSQQKQPLQILQAFAQLYNNRPDAELVMVGPDKPALKAAATMLGIGDAVIWKSEVPQKQLVQEIARSKALILYSAFETFGCVVIEALATGVPVIASDIPPIQELLKNRPGNWLVPLGDTTALANAMQAAIATKKVENEAQFTTADLAEFAYENVAEAFYKFYGINML